MAYTADEIAAMSPQQRIAAQERLLAIWPERRRIVVKSFETLATDRYFRTRHVATSLRDALNWCDRLRWNQRSHGGGRPARLFRPTGEPSGLSLSLASGIG